MKSATTIAIKQYCTATCIKAFDRHENFVEGENTIGFVLKLTTRQADAAINAGREILRSGI